MVGKMHRVEPPYSRCGKLPARRCDVKCRGLGIRHHGLEPRGALAAGTQRRGLERRGEDRRGLVECRLHRGGLVEPS